jgi:hypothetical protein
MCENEAGCARIAEVPAVVTATVTDAAVEPFSVTELEDKEQTDWDGAPVQLSVTV